MDFVETAVKRIQELLEIVRALKQNSNRGKRNENGE